MTGQHNESWDTRAVRTGRQWKKSIAEQCFFRENFASDGSCDTRAVVTGWRTSCRPSGRAVCLRTRHDGPVTTGRHDGSCVAGLSKLTFLQIEHCW